MFVNRRERAFNFLLIVLLIPACFDATVSTGTVKKLRPVSQPPNSGSISGVIRRTGFRVFAPIVREESNPGLYGRFVGCFFPEEKSIDELGVVFKIENPSFEPGAESNLSKIYLTEFSAASYAGDLQSLAGRARFAGATLTTAARSRIEASAPIFPASETVKKGHHKFDSAQARCLKSFAGDPDLVNAKSVYKRLIELQHEKERVVDALMQFSQLDGDALHLKLNELRRSIEADKARFFLGSRTRQRLESRYSLVAGNNRPVDLIGFTESPENLLITFYDPTASIRNEVLR